MNEQATCPYASQPRPLQVGMLLYPRLTLLDLIGPQTVLAWHGQTHLVAKSMDLVIANSEVGIQPTTDFSGCPDDLDILFVPGGMEDSETLQFLADRGARAGWVTSVCSGSLILAAAGLLQGYKSTTHWSAYDALAAMGVDVVRERVVVDRNRLSGGGVTASLDFGLTLLARLRGEEAAKMTQLSMEYDPKPPFDCGTPDAAGPKLTRLALAWVQSVDDQHQRRAQAADAARGRLTLA